ncbi:leucine-rich repeat domain-containing protein [Methanomethylophilus alvi]|uniref:leucine-rich repeat domain-containing protein n=1 Tax=Methanomethylophilus alvi TaxID=1291540 RepID=UPI0037DCBF63
MNDSDSSEAASETSGSCGADLAWSYDSSTGALTVTGSGSMTDFSYSDTRWGGNDIKSVSLPDGLTSIGGFAFFGCTSLSSVTIPDSVTSIGNGAFSGCTSLTAINVAEGNTAYISENGVLFNKSKTSLIQYPVGKTDSAYTIPDSVTYIGYDAFWGCTSLSSVTIPDSVTSIGEFAFSGCTSLSSVTIPDSVTTIEDCAFYGCTSLTSVTIPDSVTSIENFAFSECTSLTSVTIGNSVTSIGYDAFSGCTSLTSVTIPDSVTSIEYYAFSRCTSLTAINVAEGNTAYCSDNGALYDKSGNALHTCPAGIESFILPNTVKSVGYGAFSGGILREVTFTSGADVSIKHSGFCDCTSLKKIIIEDSAKVVFGPDAIRYTDFDKHTVYVKAPEGFKMPGNALCGNVEIIYGEPPSGEFPILYAVIGIIAVLALAGGAIVVKKRKA